MKFVFIFAVSRKSDAASQKLAINSVSNYTQRGARVGRHAAPTGYMDFRYSSQKARCQIPYAKSICHGTPLDDSAQLPPHHEDAAICISTTGLHDSIGEYPDAFRRRTGASAQH
jgi:hypothetical protein